MTDTTQTTTSPDFNTISTWTAADYALLTANLVQSMTIAQVQAMLHPEQVPTAAVSGFTPEQISSIKVTFYPTAAWINALNIPALQALSPAAFYHVTRPQLVGVDAAHLSALTAAQVAGTNKLDALSSAQFGLLNISGMSVSQIAGLTATEYAGLSAAQISSLSPSQISAIANIVNLPLAAVSGLTANQLAVLSVDFSTVSVNWLNALNTNTFQSLSAAQIGQLSATTLGALDDAHLSALTAGQVAACSDLTTLTASQFGLLNISGLSTTQIASLNATEFSGLTAAQISSLSPSQVAVIPSIGSLSLAAVSGLTANQMAAITTDFSTLSVDWLNALNTNAFQSLSTAQIAQISAVTVCALDDAHLSALTANQVAACTALTTLTNAQFSLLNLRGVSASVMAGWSQQVWAGLTAAQVSTFSIAQIESFQHASWLPATAAAGLLPSQMAALTSNYSQFSADWFNHLQLSSFTALDTGRLSQISWSAFSGMDSAHLTALSAAQVAAMTNLGSMPSGAFGHLNISALSGAQISALTLSQYQGLTPTQITSLSTAQIQALAHPEWLAPGVINNISVAQFSAMTTDQFASMTPGAISSLDAAHLAAWPGDVTALTQQELLEVAPRLTNTQLNQLTASQQSLLAASDSTAQSLINSLSDAGLKSIMQSVESGVGTLFSFSAIESVLKTLDAGISDGLSASQYAGLQSYTQDIGQVCGENSSIYSLINSMVNGANGASVDWVNADGTYSRIGNLAVGSSATQFGEEISAWLDGTNRPASSSTYYTDGRLLFGKSGTPSINDISQGQLDDCGTLAAAQTVANVSPDFIKSMFVQNANGTYSVRFFDYDTGKADWVTVDNQTYTHGEGVSGSSWGAIYERASAAFRSSFDGRNNSYGVIGGGYKELYRVTGNSISTYGAPNYSQSSWETSIYNTLKQAVLEGEPAIIQSEINTNDDTHFVANHAMTIASYDAATDKFVIANPWGTGGNGLFEASIDEMRQGGKSWIFISNSMGASSPAGQLVTAMATTAPVSAATSSTSGLSDAAPQSAPLLTAAHA
ncbi:C2 family cysteine protease [Buttiauxella gaviniae]|uniref:C2 family cysteine protease n=1 Tax=Buttiauxella gaviniae TaxID=82990 RepID=A0ABV3NZM2_9ENTR